MWHTLLDTVEFWRRLYRLDEGQLAEAQARGCRWCGGRLDRADYPRKAAGVPAVAGLLMDRRFSLCCERDGCRRRCTPVSVRFHGRRIYAAAVFVAACLEARVAANVPRQTVVRWLRYFGQTLPASAFWKTARARLMPPVDVSTMPKSLVERMTTTSMDALTATLHFLAPLSSKTAPAMRGEM